LRRAVVADILCSPMVSWWHPISRDVLMRSSAGGRHTTQAAGLG
jgi:hypothetical protein